MVQGLSSLYGHVINRGMEKKYNTQPALKSY